jgi:hypothetical protein
MPDLIDGIPSATPLGQGGVSEQPVGGEPGGASPIPVSVPPSAAPQGGDEEVRRLQSIADRRLAENYRLEAQLEAERQMRESRAAQPQAPTQNPYNPQTNFVEWQDWNLRAYGEQIADKVSRVTEEKFARLIQTAQEAAWQNQHTDVDINAVKSFARSRGISNLDDALIVMNAGQNVQRAAQNASLQALNSFRQPQAGATPLRGAEPAGPEARLSFVETLKAYRQDPSIYERWTPELRADFDRELKARYAQS